MKIKVISWNIWGGKYLDKVISFLKEADADIIALQEIIEDDDGGNTALTISKALGYECVFDFDLRMSSKWSGPERTEEKIISVGNAILSRHEIISSMIHRLSKNNTAVQADIQIGSSILHVCSIHLKHQHVENPDSKNDIRQKEQVDALLKVLPRESTIVMGDFNSLQGTYPILEMKKSFSDSEKGISSPTWMVYKEGCDVCPPKLEYKFDYIFISKEIKTVSFSVGDSKASDHLPVSAVIEV